MWKGLEIATFNSLELFLLRKATPLHLKFFFHLSTDEQFGLNLSNQSFSPPAFMFPFSPFFHFPYLRLSLSLSYFSSRIRPRSIQLFISHVLQHIGVVLYSVAVVHPFRLSFHHSLSLCLRPGFPRQPSLSLVLLMEPPPPPQHSAKHHNYPAAGKKRHLWFMLVPHSPGQTARDVSILYVINVTE